MLAEWKSFVPKFVKVMPQDYKRVLTSLKRVQSQGLTGDEAIMGRVRREREERPLKFNHSKPKLK